MRANLSYFLTSSGQMPLSGLFCEAAVSSVHFLPHTGTEAMPMGSEQETIRVIAVVLRNAPRSPLTQTLLWLMAVEIPLYSLISLTIQ